MVVRIGIDVSRSNPNVIYAQMEVGANTGTGGEELVVGGGASPTPTPSPTATPAASPTPALLDPKKPGVWRSDDKGRTWHIISNENNRPMYYSQIRVDPGNPAHVYVYGGLQDNGSGGGPSQTRTPAGITNADWYRTGGGDGFYSQADPSDYNIIYSESQNGSMVRTDMRTGRSVGIRPRVAARRGGGAAGGGRRGGTQPTASSSPTPEAQDPQTPLAPAAPAPAFGRFIANFPPPTVL